jgi:lipopolysaccharide export system protein LptA
LTQLAFHLSRLGLLAVFAAVVLTGSSASGQALLSLQTSSQPIQFSADDFACDDAVGRCEVSGHVALISGTTLLSSDHLSIDYVKDGPDKRQVTGAVATGDVLLVDGSVMTTCERIKLDPDLIGGSLGLAEIHVK